MNEIFSRLFYAAAGRLFAAYMMLWTALGSLTRGLRRLKEAWINWRLPLSFVGVFLVLAVAGAAIIWWPLGWGCCSNANRALGVSLMQWWTTIIGLFLALLGGAVAVLQFQDRPKLSVSVKEHSQTSAGDWLGRTQVTHSLRLSVFNAGNAVAASYRIVIRNPTIGKRGRLLGLQGPSKLFQFVPSEDSDDSWQSHWKYPESRLIFFTTGEATFRSLGQSVALPGGPAVEIDGLCLRFYGGEEHEESYDLPYVVFGEWTRPYQRGSITVETPRSLLADTSDSTTGTDASDSGEGPCSEVDGRLVRFDDGLGNFLTVV